MPFTSLEQRMAQSYVDMLPPFVPEENAPVSAAEQEFSHALLSRLFQLAFDEPLLFVASLQEDDAYPSRYKKPYGKPELHKNMKQFTAAMDTLLRKMFLAGRSPDVTPGKRQRAIQSRLGINDFAKLPPAWTRMSTRPDACLTFFAHCLFNKDYPYTSDMYARLLGEQSFRRLEAWTAEKGYKRYHIYDITSGDCDPALTFANQRGARSAPAAGLSTGSRIRAYRHSMTPMQKVPPFLACAYPAGYRSSWRHLTQ